MAQPTVKKGATDEWRFQESYVERLLDNAAFTSAHPDDTLILAGPARLGSGADFASSLLAIGVVQNFMATQNKMVTPMMSIGSGRQFFVSGKAQTSFNMARLFVNGRNLLRVLYTNAKQAGVDVSQFDDPAATEEDNQFFVNLDSELFLIPFGLAILFKDKIHNSIGAFYMELCMLNSWSINFSAGQNFIMENVSGMADRVLPLNVDLGGAKPHPDKAKFEGIITDANGDPYGQESLSNK